MTSNPSTSSDDPFDLARFVSAQTRDYETAIAELRAGRKRSHWIWYVLPQLRGLGLSRLSNFYGISTLDEGRAYLAHPVLGPRLRECVAAIDRHKGVDASRILGDIDAVKYRSCLTLFKAVKGQESIFAAALDGFFQRYDDPRTLELLAGQLKPDR